mmetsp:Transcript_19544/g.36425  ORF Transcript_19544/g.36425 Transcript_19544/m.36425 type:complete len:260 (+) Transcript_19544:147-926(+)
MANVPEVPTETSYQHYPHRVGIHRAASSTWGDANCARLCGIIMESNNGIEQSVQENRYDLLDSYSKRQLETPDDLGLSLVFLAIQYDQPDMLEYCAKRGLDLKSFCDPMKFGNAMFYAITLKKYRLISLLNHLGCKVNEPCNDLKQLPIDIADRMNDDLMRKEIFAASHSEIRAAHLFLKNFLKSKARRAFLKKRVACIQIQRIIRGFVTRIRVKQLAKEYAEWLILNPREEDILYPTDKKKKKKGKVNKRLSSKKLST